MATTKIPVELSSTPGIVDNSNATAITIDSSERVGIGTTSPDYPLEVENTGVYHVNVKQTKTSTSDTSAYATYYLQNLAGSSGTISGYLGAGGAGVGNAAMRNTVYMGAQSNHEVAIFTNDVERVRINTSGNVGIGAGISYNASANNSLTIGATNRTSVDNGRYFNFQFKVSGGATGQDLIIQAARNIDGSSEDTESIFQYDTSADAQIFYTNGVERARIDSNGKVGVGTSSANGLLHIGDSNAEGSSANPALQIGGANTYRLGFYTDSEGGIIQNLNGDNGLQFRVKTAGEVMRIMPSGNVGINDTSPDRKLSIIGDSTSNGQYPLSLDATNTDYTLEFRRNGSSEWWIKQAGSSFNIHENGVGDALTIKTGGNIGIGETTPLGKLHVKSADSGQSAADGTADELVVENSGDSGLSILSGTSNYGTILFGDSGDSAAGRIRYEHSHAALNFGTNSSWNRMWISSTGKVGINTTSPDELLQVELGDIKVEGAANASTRGLIIAHTGQTGNLTMLRQDSSGSRGILETTERNLRISAGSGGGTGTAETLDFYVNGSERMMIDTTGNVGIGTSSPLSSAKVHSYTGTTNGQAFHAQGLGGNNFKIVPYCSNGAFSSLTSEDDVCLIAQNAGGIVLGHHASGYYGMRVQSTGTINIGTKTEANGSTGGCSFSADSSNRRNFICATTGSGNLELIEFRNPNGTVGTIKSNGSSTSYNTSSDYRLKENVTYTWDATSRLKQLKPARFNFKADADVTLDGFLAHEVSSVVPQAVSGEKDGEKMQELDHSKLVPLLVKTIQELEARIKVLEDK